MVDFGPWEKVFILPLVSLLRYVRLRFIPPEEEAINIHHAFMNVQVGDAKWV